MLKLEKIYSNNESIFPAIQFRTGLNIVYAAVTKKAQDKRSSHSLGKTKFADLIDYCLIKKAGKDFFLRNNDAFKEFVFYLEIKISKNHYVTIARPVLGKVSLYSSNAPTNLLKNNNFTLLENKVGIDVAQKRLDQILNLSVVKEALGSYRKGLRYCIRRQEEFLEIFKAKNVNEKDRDWKPYLSGLLGVNADLVSCKYNTKETINKLKTAIRELESIDSPEQSAAALEAEIMRAQKTFDDMETELSGFSFQKTDKHITNELIDNVGQKIAVLNSDLYSVEQRLSDIDESLKADFDYDVEQVKELFSSIEINLPDQLVTTYDDLISLNKQMTHGRKEHLHKAKEKLLHKLEKLGKERSELDNKQEELSNLLLEKESFKKYKALQKRHTAEASKLAVLHERLEKLDSAGELRKRLADTVREEQNITEKLIFNARQTNNGIIKNINGIFSELVKDSLDIDTFFYLTINKEGNPQYLTGISDETSVNKGHSYNKVMAACFDCALLVHYSDSQYFRFAYHDGLFESLDDRVKLRLINSLRVIAERNELQLIITVLDSDVPEDQEGSKIYFKPDEIIKELHDRGASGRLFQMNEF